MSIFKQRKQALEVAKQLRKDVDERDAFYEKYGSSIYNSLTPLADVIEVLVDTDLELGLNLAESIGEHYFPVDTTKHDGAIASFKPENIAELAKWLQHPKNIFQITDEIRFENRYNNNVVLVVSIYGNETQTVQLGNAEQEKLQEWLSNPVGTCDLGSRLKVEQNRRGFIVFIVEAFKS